MKILAKIFFLLLIAILYSCSDDTIHIVHLTDVHGHYYPYDYAKGKSNIPSLANVYTFVDSLRNEGEKVLLIDTGDLLQGSPMAYYFNKIDTDVINPAALVYNYMGLSAMVMGNHDIEQGPEVYQKFINELDAPVLSANAIKENNKTAFPPYTFFDIGNKRIALIGLTTPAIPVWLTPEHYPGISWEGIVKSAGKYINKLEKESTFVIAGVHAGLDSSALLKVTRSKGLPRENNVLGLVETYPELNLVLCGHEHRLIPGTYHQNTGEMPPMSMPRHSAFVFNHITIADNKVKSIEVIKTSWYQPDQGILELLKPYHLKTLNYINAPLLKLSKPLDMKSAFFYDNALLDFIQNVQIIETGADLSFAACFSTRAKLDRGTVRIKDIFSIYKYENYLYGIYMTGTQIDQYLEESAKFFSGANSNTFTDEDIPGFNYDIAANAKYTIDISRPFGKRVKIKEISGRKFNPNKRYKVAINSYRINGGGGLLPAAGIQNPEVYFQSDLEIRDILINALKNGAELPLQPDNNFKVTGDINFDKKVTKWFDRYR